MSSPVGFVGTGALGSSMAHRLLAAGHDVVVHNRTRAHAASLEAGGAQWADSPAELARRCPVVLGCLLDSAAVEQVYLAPDGLLSGAGVDSVFVEHGTFDAALARRLGGVATFVDAPVTGGPEGAAGGTLAAMVGGDAAAVERVRPLVGAYCASLTHVGGVGAGLELKLVNQLLVGVHMAAAGEAVALMEILGMDLDLAGSVLRRGWAASAMLERTLDLVASERLVGTGATIGGMVDVQTLVADLVESAAADAPVFATARRTFADAASRAADADPAALAALSRIETA